MTVRHEVENLVRRGNIFYWRPRIPSCFLSCRSGSRLSLSLQLSDHKKAQVIARRLNLCLVELKQERGEFMRMRTASKVFAMNTSTNSRTSPS